LLDSRTTISVSDLSSDDPATNEIEVDVFDVLALSYHDHLGPCVIRQIADDVGRS
jgi:hypothetical protein